MEEFLIPDITGVTGANGLGTYMYFEGCFEGALIGTAAPNGTQTKNGNARFRIKASKSSSVYSKSAVVQPKTFYALTIIKL